MTAELPAGAVSAASRVATLVINAANSSGVGALPPMMLEVSESSDDESESGKRGRFLVERVRGVVKLIRQGNHASGETGLGDSRTSSDFSSGGLLSIRVELTGRYVGLADVRQSNCLGVSSCEDEVLDS